MHRYLVIALLAACIDQPEVSTAELAVTSSYVSAVNTAETGYAGAVVQNVVANASAVGRAIAAPDVVTGYSLGRTVAGAPTTARSQLLFVSRQASGNGRTYAPGLYEIAGTSSGVSVYYFDPAAGRIDLHLTALPDQSEFHTPFGHAMCGNTPPGLHDFCERMCACYAYDLYC